MHICYESSFEKDVKKVKNKAVRRALKDVVLVIKNAQSPHDISGLKKLRGYDAYYRLRIGDYRLGLELTADTFILTRFCIEKMFIVSFLDGSCFQ